MFVVGKGITSVTGDFGNWIFSKEFHPINDDTISRGYADSKLTYLSEQTCSKFDTGDTIELIEQFRNEFIELHDRDMNEDEVDWLEQLDNHVYDEIEYTYVAYREKPDNIDYDSVPFGTIRHPRLDIIYDVFDEICKVK